MTREITLTKGYVALVDNEDYEWLMQWEWIYDGGRTGRYQWNGKRTAVLTMHSQIFLRAGIDVPNGMLIDHKDRNPLNNQKSNLRLCNPAQNAWNRSLGRDNTSGFKGVTRQTQTGQWQVKIKYQKITRTFGSYENIYHAAYIYNIVATWYFGEFAALNEIPVAVIADEILLPTHPSTRNRLMAIAPQLFEGHLFGSHKYRGLNAANKSGYRGVCWRKRDRKWRAQIGYKSNKIYLGCFDDKDAAARAYNKASVELYGELAYLNVIPETTEQDQR
jgi:hypothetical protein